LVVGNTNAKFAKLINKWFFGMDLPITKIGTKTYAYATTYGTLFSTTGPSHLDEDQGYVGDCYLIAALGSLADSSQKAIKNMFVANGDGTWTVRFYYNGKADFVTVNRNLPVDSSRNLVFQGCGYAASSYSPIWLALLEKAYCQWNESGRTGRSSTANSYAAIVSGSMGTVYRQALGYVTTSYMSVTTSGAFQTLVNALNTGQAVTIGTKTTIVSSTGLHGNHAYNVLSYNSSTGLFTLFNPWGPWTEYQPNQLTWAQLVTNCTGFAATVTTATTPISAVRGSLCTSIVVQSDNTILSRVDVWATRAVTSQDDAMGTPKARAVDAVFADRNAAAERTTQRTATMLQSIEWRLSETEVHSIAKSSGNVFADIDTLFDSMPSRLALAL